MTNRIPDTNGWIEVKNNPLSVAGVFLYRGDSIPGADPAQVYGVLRSPEALSDPEAMASARLLPWVNDHPDALLGDEAAGRASVEEKGVHGVIGEDIHFADGTLYGNIKAFSQSLADDIASGKTQLSMGYACKFVPETGVFDGQPYQYRQERIRFNHVALVDRGRCGSDVAVLDSLDPGVTPMNEDKNTPATPPATPPAAASGGDQETALLSTAIEALQQLVAMKTGGGAAPPAAAPAAAPTAPDAAATPTTEDAAETPEGEQNEADRLIAAAQEVVKVAQEEKAEGAAPAAAGDESDDKPGDQSKPDDDKPAFAQDGFTMKKLMQQIAERDRLAQAIKPHVGVFDHADMTLEEVAQYGAKKLGIQTAKGSEMAALTGYLQAKAPPRPLPATGTAMDGADKPKSALEKYLTEGA